MKFFLENEHGEIEKATADGITAHADYVSVVDTGDGIEIQVKGGLRCHLDYAEISRVEACLKMLEASSGSELLGYFKIYKGDKI